MKCFFKAILSITIKSKFETPTVSESLELAKRYYEFSFPGIQFSCSYHHQDTSMNVEWFEGPPLEDVCSKSIVFFNKIPHVTDELNNEPTLNLVCDNGNILPALKLPHTNEFRVPLWYLIRIRLNEWFLGVKPPRLVQFPFHMVRYHVLDVRKVRRPKR